VISMIINSKFTLQQLLLLILLASSLIVQKSRADNLSDQIELKSAALKEETSAALSHKSQSEFSGEISPQKLIKEFSTFNHEFQNYMPTAPEIELFKKLKPYKLKVFFGTWCHDSQREVPRLIKLVKLSGVGLNQIKLIALNQNKELPQSYQATFNVEFTPSIFLMKNGIVINQVIESPQQNLAADLTKSID
jgi:thioredoxin 1